MSLIFPQGFNFPFLVCRRVQAFRIVLRREFFEGMAHVLMIPLISDINLRLVFSHACNLMFLNANHDLFQLVD